MTAGEARGGPAHFLFAGEKQRISLRLVAAKKDNDFIYHDRVPSHASMPSVDKLSVAKRNANICNDNMSDNFKGEPLSPRDCLATPRRSIDCPRIVGCRSDLCNNRCVNINKSRVQRSINWPRIVSCRSDLCNNRCVNFNNGRVQRSIDCPRIVGCCSDFCNN